MKIKLLASAFVLAFFIIVDSYGQKKQDLKVLYVGYQPSKPIPENLSITAIGGMSRERFKEEYKTRYPAFVNYLKATFSTVKGVDARDYRAEMSEGYDVTIFDQVPKALSERKFIKNANGQITGIIPAGYIDEEFDHATIFIGHTAPVMGRAIGLKLDWLCLCLDADAHHIKTGHPVFRGPLKVSLTLENKPTPSGIYNYPSGADVPEEIPMWRVQKEGYLEGKGYRVGLVSRGNGFLDSPDTEYIASGVNTKDVGAVAIGRHGNFLLWGFSASPDYMTDEAKKVFANAVVYMRQFKGKNIMARKYDERIRTRETVNDIKFRLDKKQYEHYVNRITELYDADIKKREAAKAKKEKGEKLSAEEEMSLEMRPPRRPEMTWEKYIMRYMKGYEEQFGTDIEAYKKFLGDNIEFLSYQKGKGYYGLIVDEDLKALGISNRKPELFDVCINLLKKGRQTTLAKRVLKRYTTERFDSAKAWSKWYKTNKNKLFFTEAGGYKWLVNTL